MPQYTRITTDYFIIQIYRCRRAGVRRDGWSDLNTETTSAAAYAWLMSCRQQGCQTCRYRIVKRRK